MQQHSPHDLYSYLLNQGSPCASDSDARYLVERTLEKVAQNLRGLPDSLTWPAEPSPHSSDDTWMDEFAIHACHWGARRAERLREAGAALTRKQWLYWLRQYQPLALHDGVWMKGCANAITAHTEFGALFHQLYGFEVGQGHPSLHHGRSFLRLCEGVGIDCPPSGSIKYAHRDEMLEQAFELPLFLLAIARFPVTFRPELVGLKVYYYTCGFFPLIEGFDRSLETQGVDVQFLSDHKPRMELSSEARIALKLARLETHVPCSRKRERQNRRMALGFAAGYLLSQGLVEEFERFCAKDGYSAEELMANIVEKLAEHASDYHSALTLENRGMDEWMDSPREFLAALARSKYVDLDSPNDSPLLKGFVELSGPMFGVFAPGDIEVLKSWLYHIASESPGSNVRAGPQGVAKVFIDAKLPGTDSANGAWPLGFVKKQRSAYVSLRELYHQLLNIEKYPEVRLTASRYLARLFKLIRMSILVRTQRTPCLQGGHEGIDRWVAEKHSEQVRSYNASSGKSIPTREDLVASTTQLAPMVFIDGAWLQNSVAIGADCDRISSRLFQIFSDEIGNGIVERNHANIFRELLEQMGVKMPVFGTHEFAMWSGFQSSAFAVPVLWLALSQFPQEYSSGIR